MPGPSKVIVLDPDARAGRQIQLGFEREGVPTWSAPMPDQGRLELDLDDAGLVVVGGTDGRGLELVRLARQRLVDRGLDLPIVFAGRGVRRTEVEAAGADEVVLQPAYLRDLVTVGRLLRGLPTSHRGHLVGSLAETTGVYTLVRALAALGRSATLTLIRGLRRGEVRFFHGEVTSAQVGLIHGQAALHQLLLWTDARFDFHHEDVVRRQQIPLSPDELFADAERFLEGVRDESGKLSPSMVLEQDVSRVQTLGKQIPTEVHGVLRMFDGHRVLADVLEDSPYRVFETLRVTQRAVEAGLLRVVATQRPKATWRAVLAIEEWLVGGQSRAAVMERLVDSGPTSTEGFERPESPSRQRGSRRSRKKRRANTPLAVPVPSKVEIDWGSLVPRVVGAEVGPLSGVVPAAFASGEIDQVTRDQPREGLEALMDTGKRERIFPSDIGLEPSVVFDEAVEHERARHDEKTRAEAVVSAREARDAAAKELAEREARDADAARIKEDAAHKIRDALARQARDREETEGRAAADEVRRRADAADRARVEAEGLARKHVDEGAPKASAAPAADARVLEADAVAAQATLEARAKLEAAAKATVEAAAAHVQAEAAAKAEAVAKAEADASAAKADADARAEAVAAAAAKADADARAEAAKADAAKAQADAAAKAQADAAAKAQADAAAKLAAKAEADAAAKTEADLAAKLATEAKLTADAEARRKAEADAKAENEARAKAEVKAKREARQRAEAEAEAADQARRAAEVTAAAEARAKLAAEAQAKADSEAAARAASAAKLAEVKVAALAAEAADKLAAMRAIADTLTASEPKSAVELVKQLITEERTSKPEITQTAPITVIETSTKIVTLHETLTVTPDEDSVTLRSQQILTVIDAPRAAVVDEPSDGVVHHISTVETAPLPQRREYEEAITDDRPPPAGGEISMASRKPVQEPDTSGPSILVSDIAAVHIAVQAVVSAQAAAPPSPDASGPLDRVAAEVRKDAVTFSDTEEAFFRAGSTQQPVKVVPPPETFEDLDEGYRPVGFWDRLIGRKPDKK